MSAKNSFFYAYPSNVKYHFKTFLSYFLRPITHIILEHQLLYFREGGVQPDNEEPSQGSGARQVYTLHTYHVLPGVQLEIC